MPNMTIFIPEEIHRIMAKHKEIRWSEVARQAIVKLSRKMELLEGLNLAEKREMFDNLLKDSVLTDADVEDVGDKIKQGILDRVATR